MISANLQKKGDRSIIHGSPFPKGGEGDFMLPLDFPKISPPPSLPKRGTAILNFLLPPLKKKGGGLRWILVPLSQEITLAGS